jgi:thiol-disulfide isomerase/thioredoxin
MMLFERSRLMTRMSVRWLWPLGATVAVILLLPIRVQTLPPSGGKSSGEPSSMIPSRSRQPAPELNVPDIAGTSVNLGSYRGKVVLLDFWAVDCGLCVTEIPWYVEFDKKYHDKGLRLLGIDVLEESPVKIKPFMQKAHMKYPVAVGNDDIKKRFQAEELPKTLLIDRQGRVAVSHAGIVDRDEFERDIQELLKEQ